MRRSLARIVKLLFWPTLALGVVIAFAPGRVELALRVYALVAAASVVAVLLVSLRASYPPAQPLRPRVPRQAASGDAPEALERIEQETALGVAGAFDLHFRLRPRLRRVASELLAARRGISLDGSPDRAREVLGAETWELLRPDRPPPEDRLARGLPINEIARVVESVERL